MASTFITRTPSSNGATTKATWSVWVKRGNLDASEMLYFASSDSNNKMIFRFNADATIDVRNKVSGSFPLDIETNRKFFDTAAWYHLVVAIDTTQATAANRFKMYVNGVQETSFSTETYPSQNTDLTFSNTDDQMWIGAESGTGAYFSGSLAHFHYTDGYTYAATDFGETDSTSGVWKPQASPSVSYGTNGFFLKFENSGNMDLDSSGNNLSFTTSGTITQNVDTPANNFATMNPLDNYYTVNSFSNANNTVTTPNSGYSGAIGGIGVSAGKWYFEFKPISKTGDADEYAVGITGAPVTSTNQPHWKLATGYMYGAVNGNVFNNDSGAAYGNTYTAGDIIGVAMDLDNNKLYFSKNGTFQNSGVPTSGSTGTGATSITAASSTPIGFYMPWLCF